MRLHRWERDLARDGYRCWLCGAFVGAERVLRDGPLRASAPQRRLPVVLIERLEAAAPECRIIRYLPLGHQAGPKRIQVRLVVLTRTWDVPVSTWELPIVTGPDPYGPTFERRTIEPKIIYNSFGLSHLFLQRGDVTVPPNGSLLRWIVRRAVEDLVAFHAGEDFGPIDWSTFRVEPPVVETWDWSLRLADYNVTFVPLTDHALLSAIDIFAREAIRETQEAQVGTHPHVPHDRQGGRVGDRSR